MKKVLFIFASMAFLLFASCQNEFPEEPYERPEDKEKEENVVPPEMERSYEAFLASIADLSAENSSDFAAPLSHLVDGQKVVWNDGDSIGVFSDKQGVGKYLYSNGAFNGASIEGKEFRAFYPFIQNAVDPEKPDLIHTRLHYSDRIKEGSFSRPLPMVAVSEDNELHFEQTCGILHFSIKSSFYVKVVYLFANDESELLCGNGVIDLSEEAPVFKMVPDDENLRYRIDYWVESYLTPDKPVDLYFIVPVGVYKQGITLMIKGNNTETGEQIILEKVTRKAVEVRRGVITSFSVVDYDNLLQEKLMIEQRERQSLMDLYNATDGDHWVRNDNWGSDKPLSEWYGILTSGDRVKEIGLSNNGLKGEIPSSIANLSSLAVLSLPDNELTGNLPETIGNLTNLKAIFLYYNKLTGTIPDSFVNLSNLECLWLSGNHMDGTLSEDLLKSDWWFNLPDKKLLQAPGYKLKYGWLYESTNFLEDGKVVQLQTHSVGKGIPIVITGDAFSDRLMDTFEQQALESMEYFFGIEPYTTFRSCFDVYLVKAVSKNEILGEDTAFSSDDHNGIMSTNFDSITDYLHKVPAFAQELGNGVGIVLVQGGEARSVCVVRYDKNSIALSVERDAFVLQHEACGHGFGRLADEYSYDDLTGNAQFENYVKLSYDHKKGVNLNADAHSDPTKVYWSDFITNSDYAIEGIGVYEGGLGRYSKGIYRPTKSSIMENHQVNSRFNAPCRWIIYQRIMQYAGLEYSFEDFLEYDKKNLAEIASTPQTSNYVEVKTSQYQPSLHSKPLHGCIQLAD